MRNAMVLMGGVLILLGVAMASTNALVEAGVPMRLFEYLKPTWTTGSRFCSCSMCSCWPSA